MEPLRIDGSYGEGGGQIVRSAVALSAISGIPVVIENVRANRERTGLQPQHLESVKAAATLCDAELLGGHVGSTEFSFRPTTKIRSGTWRFDIDTAGATTLVIQAILAPLITTGEACTIVVTGGTHNEHAPSADYLGHVLLPALGRLGLEYQFGYERAGFYPKGGGEIRLQLNAGSGLKGMLFDQVTRPEPIGVIVTSNLAPEVAMRGSKVMEGLVARIYRKDLPAFGVGAAALTAFEGLAGFTSLGKRGKPIERVVEDAVEPLSRFRALPFDVDEHLADQLIVPLLCASGQSRFTTWMTTEHLRTVVWISNQFAPGRAKLVESIDGSALVEVLGPLSVA